MNIGTAKPRPSQLNTVCHHFIDRLDPNQVYSAGAFGRESKQTINILYKKNKIPVVVGGSGLYIQALVDGLYSSICEDNGHSLRMRLEKDLKEHGLQRLYRHLEDIDPWAHARLQPKDSRRILRALEMANQGKAQHQYWQNKVEPQPHETKPLIFGLTMSRERLYSRIDARVDAMMKEGFLAEVEALKGLGYDLIDSALNTFGYRELISYLSGEYSKTDAIESIKKQTRNYAKRQWTWFRRDRRIRWFNLDSININGIEERILEELKWRQNEGD
jgi:tRNA dimethylallyltransferase